MSDILNRVAGIAQAVQWLTMACPLRDGDSIHYRAKRLNDSWKCPDRPSQPLGPSTAEVKNARKVISIHSYAFMACTWTTVPSPPYHRCVNMEIVQVCEIREITLQHATFRKVHIWRWQRRNQASAGRTTPQLQSQFTRTTMSVRKLYNDMDQILWLFSVGKMRRWTRIWLGGAVCGLYCFTVLY
jgi:hypothetical protein